MVHIGIVWRSAVLFVLASAAPALADIGAPAVCTNYLASADAAAACDAAIAAESDARQKSALLTRRAYARDTKPTRETLRDAFIDLGEAIKLDPENAGALHERAFLLNEFGQWKEARADLDAQIKLLPDEPTGYSERALARFNLADFQGAFEDRSAEVRLAPTASARLALARTEMWLGRFDDAEKDIAEARKLVGRDAVAANATNVVSAELTFWRSSSPDGASACDPAKGKIDYNTSFLVGDCTKSFLAAGSAKEKAAALSARSLAWITGANDVGGFVEDSKLAAALDPENPNLRSNLGFAYLRLQRPDAAILQFDAAIALSPDFAKYAGRAQAKFNAGDLNGAEADATKSVEYQPNRIALTILGDVAYARTKTFDTAKDFWLKAYDNGPPDDGLIKRLTAAGVAIPASSAPESANPAPAPDAKTGTP